MSVLYKFTDNETNMDWHVRLVFKGDRYGLDMCLTHDEDEMLVEFYDCRYDFASDVDGTVLGQFVSRYYFKTLRKTDWTQGGLNLDGGVDSWSVGSALMVNLMILIHRQPECQPELLEAALQAEEKVSNEHHDMLAFVSKKLKEGADVTDLIERIDGYLNQCNIDKATT